MARMHNRQNNAMHSTERLSRNGKQFKIQFTRESSSSGKYKTRFKLVREERSAPVERGIIHRINNLKYRFTGDVPSVSKAIDSMHSGSLKITLKAADKAVRIPAGTVMKAGLAAETAVMRTAENAEQEIRYKLKSKYRQHAVDDGNRAVVFTAETISDTARGLMRHHRQKVNYRIEAGKLKELKLDRRIYSKDRIKNLKSRKKELRLSKKKFREIKKDFRTVSRNSSSYSLRKNLVKERKVQYRIKLKEQKSEVKKLKTEIKGSKAKLKNQKKITRHSKPGVLALKPAAYAGRQIKQSAWQKAAYEDDTNDALRAADTVKRHGTDRAVRNLNHSSKLHRQNRKRSRLEAKESRSGNRLQKQDNRLSNRKTKNKNKYKTRSRNRQMSAGQKVQAEFKKLLNTSVTAAKSDAAFLMKFLPVVLLILLIFMLIVSVFNSILTGSGFTLATYCAQDYALSESEEYYTSLAWEMNRKIRKISDGNWKDGLKELGIDTKDMKDKPDNLIWGKSSELNYDPDYDFDRYKLWSFLCAYYYDFSVPNKDIKYWKYGNDTKDLIKEIFEKQYKFEYRYVNYSRWEELDRYDFEGGINGTYWVADSNGVYRDSFRVKSCPGEINGFTDGSGYLHFNGSLEILNARDEYKQAGWFLQDQRYIVSDRSGQSSNPFYGWYNGTEFGHTYGSQYYPRARWGWDDFQIYFMVSPQDTKHWNSGLDDSCLISFYRKNIWKNDCTLYYSVKKEKTLDQVIEDKLKSMSDADERYAYYRLLAGFESVQVYGNHQTLSNPLDGGSLKAYPLLNPFGYDMQDWNQQHCGIDSLHKGIDVVCSSGADICAPVKCTVKSYDAGKGTVVLRRNDLRYWYDGHGGQSRDTEIYISNITLNSGIKEGDTLDKLQVFAKVNENRKCDGSGYGISQNYIHIKVKVDTDGFGWDFIDPLLVFY